VDGVEDSQNASGTGWGSANGHYLFIGMRFAAAGGDTWWEGSISSVRIYNRALSPAEILDRYQTGARKLKIDPGSPGVILLN
jgi:hypothetical protein